MTVPVTLVDDQSKSRIYENFTIKAPLVEIRWKSSDEHNGLSEGATATIGVCLPLLILASIAVGVFLLRRRKRRSRIPAQLADTASAESDKQLSTRQRLIGDGSEQREQTANEPIEASPLYEAERTDPRDVRYEMEHISHRK